MSCLGLFVHFILLFLLLLIAEAHAFNYVLRLTRAVFLPWLPVLGYRRYTSSNSDDASEVCFVCSWCFIQILKEM